jgi:glycosyltransferase involved in cell wall biosynthesis
VVRDFSAALPGAIVYVYDNNSRDRTVDEARAAGAVVRTEPRQGKGNVVRRMFADIEADIYVLVDGDDTYDAEAAPRMIETVLAEGCDLLTARRIHTDAAAYRPGHVLGNRLLTGLTAWLFNVRLSDMLSGYRVFSRRFVKSFPFTAEGFGIETELTVHAVRLMMPLAEIDTRYKERPARCRACPPPSWPPA